MSTQQSALSQLKTTLDLAVSQANAIFTAYTAAGQPEKDAIEREAETVLNPSMASLKTATEQIL